MFNNNSFILCQSACPKSLRVPVAILFGLLLSACGGGSTAPASVPLTSVALPETGQTTCTDTAGAVIACTGTGQDGDLKAGVAWPAPRFVAGTGATAACVTDNLTGLMWPADANLAAATRTWQQALDDANALTLCGFTDWRLPNVNELESLVNSETANLATILISQGFTNVQANNYWSSTSRADSPANAWFVLMSDGYVSTRSKSDSHYVWPVRAGQ